MLRPLLVVVLAWMVVALASHKTTEREQELEEELGRLLEQHQQLLRELRACKAATGWESVQSDPAPTPVPAPITSVRIPVKVGFEAGIDHVGGPQRLFYVPKMLSEANRKHLVDLVDRLTPEELAESTDPVLLSTLRVLDAVAMVPNRNHTLPPRTQELGASAPTGLHLASSMRQGKRSTVLLLLRGHEHNGTGLTFPRAVLTEQGVLRARLLSLGAGISLAEESAGVMPLTRLWAVLEQWEHSWYYGSMGGHPPHGFTDREALYAALQAADERVKPPRTKAGRRDADPSDWCSNRGILTLRPKPGDALLLFHHDAQLGLDHGAMHGYCPPLPPAVSGRETALVRDALWFDPRSEEGNLFHRVLQAC